MNDVGSGRTCGVWRGTMTALILLPRRTGSDGQFSYDRPRDGYLLPPSVDEWLPEKHLARFVVEVVDGLDLGRMSRDYRGSGSASYHPRMLLGLLVYGYATGVFSSRKLERATYDSVAFRFIAANDHPDHDTIATFRRRFLKEIEKLFVQVLLLAREMGMLKMGAIGLDGTKIHAKAGRQPVELTPTRLVAFSRNLPQIGG